MKTELYKAAQEAIASHDLKHGDTFRLRNSAGTEFSFRVNQDGEPKLLVTSVYL